MLWRILALAVGAVLVGSWTHHALHLQHPWAAALTPPLLAAYALALVRGGCFILCEREGRRRRAEERAAYDDLTQPGQAHRPGGFDGIARIESAQQGLLPRIPDYEGDYRVAGVTAALLSPLAVFCLGLQVVFWTQAGWWAVGLVIAESLLLMYLIFLVWSTSHPAQAWTVAQLRAELLRREQYLRLAMVGPYLGLAEPAAHSLAGTRTAQIERWGEAELVQAIPLAGPREGSRRGDRSWIDQLWSDPTPRSAVQEVAERMDGYLHHRIRRQTRRYNLAAELNERGERRTGVLLKTVVVMAALAAVLHATLLACEPAGAGELPAALHRVAAWMTLLALVLPPFSAAVLALQHRFAVRALAGSYRAAASALVVQQANLEHLIQVYPSLESKAELQRAQTEFQALVLRTEEILLNELRHWLTVHSRPEPGPR